MGIGGSQGVPIIAGANQKGGIGKATSTLNLGAALQAAGKRVLLAMGVLNQHPRGSKLALYIGALEERAGRAPCGRAAIALAEQVDTGWTLFADVARQVGLAGALDMHRASRTSLAGAS
jgi:hypothetical protein